MKNITVPAGGYSYNSTISANTIQHVYGSAVSSLIRKGGYQIVYSGGSTMDTTMEAGAVVQVNKGGSAGFGYISGVGTIDARSGASVDINPIIPISGGMQWDYTTPVNAPKIKVQGIVKMQAVRNPLQNMNVTGTKNAQIKVINSFRLASGNTFANTSLNLQNNRLSLAGTGNKFAKLITNTKSSLNFDLYKVNAKDTKYMLTATTKSAIGGRISITVDPDQQWGTYELISNLAIGKNQEFYVNVSSIDSNGNTAFFGTQVCKTDGKAQSYRGTTYKLNYSGNKLSLVLSGEQGQIVKGTKGTLEGTEDQDIFYGGSGNNTIIGNGGRDVAVYDTKAWGKDRIDANGGDMTILFAGIKSSQVTKTLVDGDMVITRKGVKNQSITVENWDESTHTLVFGGTLGQFSKYVATAKPNATQKNNAYNEVWKKSGFLA